MSDLPLVLLPPSEGKADGGATPAWSPDQGAFGQLADLRHAVVAALVATGGGSERLLGLKGERLAAEQALNRLVLGAPTLPAWRRYTGVVWAHLDPEGLGAMARRRIVVPSGLLGLVRGDDPVPRYRLQMGASISPLGKLSTWWRDSTTAALVQAARRRPVVDLLPQQHRLALVLDDRLDRITVDLVDEGGKAGGHFAKAAKGKLARAVLDRGIEVVDGWSDERFRAEVRPLGSDR